MAIDFDRFIKDNVIYYDPDFTMNNVIYELVNNEWDIIAYRDSCEIKKNKKVPFMYRDIIMNVKSTNSTLFYVIDDIEIPIRDDTKLITALTPFKIVNIKAIGSNGSAFITFTRLFLKNNLINNLRKEIVFDSTFTYYNGEII